MKYHKIQTMFKRDPATKYKTLLENEWSEPEFDYLKGNEWIWTEKIDGTNIRVMWDGESRRFGGKTDNAQLYVPLYEKLTELFPLEALSKQFGDEPTDVIMFGEGYGAKIQKGGGNYIPDGVGFILFDILIGNVWLRRDTLEEIAECLLIPIVPVIAKGTLQQAAELTRTGFVSLAAEISIMAEGLVLRPSIELKNRMGRRIITKIKHKDFQREDR